MASSQDDHVNGILDYHRLSKHHPQRYAPSPGRMEWATQPHPFRHYEDAPYHRLGLLKADPQLDYADLFFPAAEGAGPQTPRQVAGFLELSLGLSAWKAVSGSRWSLRINPSSGNLHPTEAHLILPAGDNRPQGIYHYDPFRHALAQRAELPDHLMEALHQCMWGRGFLVILTSIFWRESWKYGVRAFRYCNHDIGHALACLRFGARLMGWTARIASTLDDPALATLLGLAHTPWPDQEAEYPQVAVWITPRVDLPDVRPPAAGTLAAFDGLDWQGRATQLSRGHRPWPQIDAVSQNALRQGPFVRDSAIVAEAFCPPPVPTGYAQSAAAIIRQRRSAVAFDFDAPAISSETFQAFLARVQFHRGHLPFDLGLGPARVHLLLFVHHVQDLPSGLYLLVRHPDARKPLQDAMDKRWRWQEIPEMPGLFLLSPGNYRDLARALSCHQEIAGDSHFAVAMLAEFTPHLESAPHRYRDLFWETGLIGQTLYLEAEAQGLRGTGIGCFFDDLVHDLLGFRDDRFQSLYHFTIGRPIEDRRIQTLPPYAHLPPNQDG